MIETLVIILLGGLLFTLYKYWQLRGEVNKANASLSAANQQLNALNSEVQQLAPYRELRDADQYAVRTIEKAEVYLRECEEFSSERRLNADTEAAETIKAARQKAKALEDQANASLAAANAEYRVIVEKAHASAREIAGAAYDALQNKEHLEQTARAMKNIIDGYGNQYLIPPDSWLDELAREYGFKEAGQKLQTARQRVRQMIADGHAADCDYKEQNRRVTALSFVEDAFNGKVDTILAKVKGDNLGTIQQKIQDAYRLVNHDGEAFRNARVNPGYLEARLDEAKWACAARELQELEKQEQREIQAAMREEEKARREYEKVLRETEKEEKLLQKAMEEARRQLESAAAEDVAKYQLKIADLQNKLQEAEERNQRALSMAQQTKRGHVYVISNIGSFGENVFKIGLTRRLEPLDRIKELGDASVPFDFDVHAMIYSEDAPNLEASLHRTFNDLRLNKINFRKEFFAVNISQIQEQISNMGIEAKWTLLAEAQQYRESLGIKHIPQEKLLEIADSNADENEE
jgi:hypothetical protein